MDKKIKTLVEGGIAVALASVLSLIVVFKMPQGGSITAGSMSPIIFYSLRRGLKNGVLAGIVFGLVNFLISPYFFSPLQVILDYGLAYGALGLAGLGKSKDFRLMNVIIFSSLAIGARSMFHILAGVIFFSSYAGSMNPWLYSLIYNGSYLVPELVITTIIIRFLYKPLYNI